MVTGLAGCATFAQAIPGVTLNDRTVVVLEASFTYGVALRVFWDILEYCWVCASLVDANQGATVRVLVAGAARSFSFLARDAGGVSVGSYFATVVEVTGVVPITRAMALSLASLTNSLVALQRTFTGVALSTGAASCSRRANLAHTVVASKAVVAGVGCFASTGCSSCITGWLGLGCILRRPSIGVGHRAFSSWRRRFCAGLWTTSHGTDAQKHHKEEKEEKTSHDKYSAVSKILPGSTSRKAYFSSVKSV